MKSELFYEYISTVFYPHVKSNNVTFPIILFVDGHKTHLDKNVSALCNKLDNNLIALYPNATRILQPADVAAFRPIKSFWKSAILDWRRTNPTNEINKENFAVILKTVVDKFRQTPETIQNGFRACGLYPWDKNAIDYSKCLGKRKTTQFGK